MATNNPARLRQIRDAVIAEMNAEIGAKDEDGNALAIPQFIADAKWHANLSSQQANSLQVYVRVLARESVVILDRGENETEYRVEICFQKTILQNMDFDSKFDGLIDLVNRVARYFRPERELSASDIDQASVDRNEMLIYDPAQLDAARFFGTVTLFVRNWADKDI